MCWSRGQCIVHQGLLQGPPVPRVAPVPPAMLGFLLNQRRGRRRDEEMRASELAWSKNESESSWVALIRLEWVVLLIRLDDPPTGWDPFHNTLPSPLGVIKFNDDYLWDNIAKPQRGAEEKLTSLGLGTGQHLYLAETALGRLISWSACNCEKVSWWRRICQIIYPIIMTHFFHI